MCTKDAGRCHSQAFAPHENYLDCVCRKRVACTAHRDQRLKAEPVWAGLGRFRLEADCSHNGGMEGVFAHAYGPRTNLMHAKGSASHYTALQTKSTHFPLRPQKRGVLLRTGTGDGVGVERAGKKD